MLYLIIAIIALGLVTAIIALFSSKKNGEPDVVHATTSDCTTCNGTDARCEQDCMMEASVKEIEYYDDEELDDFIGRPSDSYTEEEVEKFSEVLYTMKQEDVAGWNRSLLLRGINIPDQLKDELVMLIKG